jgi:RHS repeat-associated protein
MMWKPLMRLLMLALVTCTNVFAQSQTIDWSNGVSYAYDGSGNIKSIGADTFVYDGAGRLIQATTNGATRTYTYDPQGNRTNCSELAPGDCQNGITVGPDTNRLNQATYDGAGNVTAFNGHAYAYDALQMQTGDAGGVYTREYLFTADDERIAVHNVGGGWTWSVRDTSGKVLREFTSNDNATTGWQWAKDYIHRDGLLLATHQREPGSSTPVTYHYHLDHLGTPRRITDASGQIVGIHDYHPFGPELSGGVNEPAPSLMKFTGHERDRVGAESASTLDYMHARYYSPSTGRFLSVDPVRSSVRSSEPQTWNRYSYALNNPTVYTDPTGKAPYKGGTMDPAKLLEEVELLEQLGMDKRALFNEISSAHSGDTNRYFYTEKFGWVDVRHFGAFAAAAAIWPDPLVSFVGGAEELRQWLSEWGNDYRSGFSPEDGPSNDAGEEFGDAYLTKNMSATEAFRQWLAAAGALPPEDARTGYDTLPEHDPSKRVPDPGKRWWQFWKD